ncbi:MAG: DUF4259 domain-containing protein [Pseudomonas sp.]
MGTWNHSYFGNDGAADLLALLEQAKHSTELWQQALTDAINSFEQFLARDARGETFRRLTAEELAAQDAAVREALADLPHLIADWDAGIQNESDVGLSADTGDHEAQGVVAAAALIAKASGDTSIALPRGLKVPADWQPSPEIVARAKSALVAIVAHEQLRQHASDRWIGGVSKLVTAL